MIYSINDLNFFTKDRLVDIYLGMIRTQGPISRKRISCVYDLHKEDIICLILGKQELNKLKDFVDAIIADQIGIDGLLPDEETYETNNEDRRI